MEKFKELQDLVKKKGFGTSQFTNVNGDAVFLSRGIKEVFLENETEEQKIIEVIGRFQKQDYGSSEEFGKSPRPGHEYGRYNIAPFNDTDVDTGVWVHRTDDAIKVFFMFEK